MNNGLSFLMVQGTVQEITTLGHEEGNKERQKCPISIECMMELMHRLNFGTSLVTKGDRIFFT